jgi:hypothetical protein
MTTEADKWPDVRSAASALSRREQFYFGATGHAALCTQSGNGKRSGVNGEAARVRRRRSLSAGDR